VHRKRDKPKGGEVESLLYAICIDVGATKLKSGIVDSRGKLYFSKDILTNHKQTMAQILNVIRSVLGRAKKSPKMRESILGIGIGVGGQVDFLEGRVIAGMPEKIPGWIGTPVKAIVEREFDLPVVVDNDGKVATLAESLFGNYGVFKDLVCVTVGSGVGSGLVIGGKIHRPARGAAGEMGHITINFRGPLCGCGNRGCLEAYVSNSALVDYARRQIDQGQKSQLNDFCNGQLDRLTPELVGKAASEGDSVAKCAIDTMANYLGIGLANIANTLGPDIIVIGGGMARLGNLFLKPVQEALKKYSFGICAKNTRIVLSSLGPYAGVIGAGALLFGDVLRTTEKGNVKKYGSHRTS